MSSLGSSSAGFLCLSLPLCLPAATTCDRFQGFSVDGQIGSDADSEDSYINKCVYVEGEGANFSPLEGFVMKDLDIYRCG